MVRVREKGGDEDEEGARDRSKGGRAMQYEERGRTSSSRSVSCGEIAKFPPARDYIRIYTRLGRKELREKG